MKTAEEWIACCPSVINDIMNQVVGQEKYQLEPSVPWVEQIQDDARQSALREAAEIAGRGGCTSAGCDPSSDFHGKRCPCGIADAILAKVNTI